MEMAKWRANFQTEFLRAIVKCRSAQNYLQLEVCLRFCFVIQLCPCFCEHYDEIIDKKGKSACIWYIDIINQDNVEIIRLDEMQIWSMYQNDGKFMYACIYLLPESASRASAALADWVSQCLPSQPVEPGMFAELEAAPEEPAPCCCCCWACKKTYIFLA